MTTELRNPYLILGLDYGASLREARRAMARLTKRLKSADDSPYSSEDLTWALHQIEQVNKDPEAGVDIFRVPANRSVFQLKEGEGLFSPPARPLPRRTSPPSEEDMGTVHALAMEEVAECIFALEGVDLLNPDY